jgi:tetratricopeptide (TPR) repeat protein
MKQGKQKTKFAPNAKAHTAFRSGLGVCSFAFAVSILSFASSFSSATAATGKDSASSDFATDRASKLTDLAALGFQEQSITKLRKLVKQYAGTSREPELMSRLADLYLQRSGITFRVSEGTSVKNKTSLYQNSLKDGIAVFSEFLAKYPSHPNAANAYFKRGKANKELGNIKEARADYLKLEEVAPHFDYIDSALNDLTDFAQDANQHQEALGYLAKLEKMKDSEYYPIALHKTAWSYFNLNIQHSALSYLGREINFYFDRLEAKTDAKADAKGEAIKNEASVETAMLESAFSDLALFSFECFNKKVEDVTVESSLALFHKLDRSPKVNGNTKYFGVTALKFARLLKAYALTPELESLKNHLIEDEMKVPETTEVALLMFQYYFERHEYTKLMGVLTDLGKVRKAAPNPDLNKKIESSIGNALAELHKQVLKNKKSTELAQLTRPLTALTQAVSDLLGADNSTAVLANFSLAETSFEIQDYAKATQLYLGLTKPEAVKVLEAKDMTAQAIQLRLLSSRFKELKNDHVVTDKLQIHSIATKLVPADKEPQARMVEWIKWVDADLTTAPASREKFSKPDHDVAAFYTFGVESAKLVYQYIDTSDALVRLENLAFMTPDTDDGQTAISIVMDTVSKSEAWQRLYDLSNKVLAVKVWKDKEFLNRVKDSNADAYLRITMATTAPEEIITRTKECVTKFKGTSVGMDCQLLQARTELKLLHFDIAEKQLTEILPHIKDKAKAQSLLLLRADAREKLGNFDASIADLSTYQSETGYKDATITQNILQHYWFKGDSQLDAMLKNPKVCSGSNEDACDQYKVVRILERDSHVDYHTVFKNSVKASKAISPLWALIALKDAKKLPFQDRLILLQRVSQHWDQVNPLVQIRLFPVLEARVGEALESIRVSAPGIAPVTADANSIERRMRLVQDVDATFAKVLKLNWLGIKIKGVNELQQMYIRLVQDLRAVQTPEDLLKPFMQKIKEVTQANQNLQEMTMTFTNAPAAARSTASVSAVKGADGKMIPAAPVKPALTTAHSAATSADITKILLSKEIQDRVPTHLWGEWKHGVDQSRRDFLFHLISVMEASTESVKSVGPILRGLVLLQSNASSEAFELIRTADDSPWKSSLMSQFTVAQARNDK